MNFKVNSELEAERITQFQINMAKETESLELNGALVREAIRYLIAHPQYGFYLGNKPKDIVHSTTYIDHWQSTMHL